VLHQITLCYESILCFMRSTHVTSQYYCVLHEINMFNHFICLLHEIKNMLPLHITVCFMRSLYSTTPKKTLEITIILASIFSGYTTRFHNVISVSHCKLKPCTMLPKSKTLLQQNICYVYCQYIKVLQPYKLHNLFHSICVLRELKNMLPLHIICAS
jgi:hypothetical protein